MKQLHHKVILKYRWLKFCFLRSAIYHCYISRVFQSNSFILDQDFKHDNKNKYEIVPYTDRCLFDNSLVVIPNKKQLTLERTSDWFKDFIKLTSEKQETYRVFYRITKLFFQRCKKIVTKNTPCSVLDIGVGEGILASHIAKTLKKFDLKVYYNAIDIDPYFIEKTQVRINYVKVDSSNVIQGDCFSEDLNKLPDNPSLVMASHIAYYTQDVNAFIQKILKKTNENTILIFIHAPIFSEHIRLRNTYGTKVTKNIPTLIKESVKEYQDHVLDSFSLFFFSFINFPEMSVNSLLEVADSAYKDIQNTESILLRNILEFIVQKPLESLKSENTLHSYVKEISSILLTGENKLQIWTQMQVFVSKRSIFYHAVKQAFNDFNDAYYISPLHWAAYHGSFSIVKAYIDELGEEIASLNNLGILSPLCMATLGTIMQPKEKKNDCLKIIKFLLAHKVSTLSVDVSIEFAEQFGEILVSCLLGEYIEKELSVGATGDFKWLNDKRVRDARLRAYTPPFNNKVLRAKVINWLNVNFPFVLERNSYYARKLVKEAVLVYNLDVLTELAKVKPEILREYSYKVDNQEINIAHHLILNSLKEKISDEKIIEILEWVRKYFSSMMLKKTSVEKTMIHLILSKSIRLKILDWVWEHYRNIFFDLDLKGRNPLFDCVEKCSEDDFDKLCSLLDWLENNDIKWLKQQDSQKNTVFYVVANSITETTHQILFYTICQWIMTHPRYNFLFLEANEARISIVHIAGVYQCIFVLEYIKKTFGIKPFLVRDQYGRNFLFYALENINYNMNSIKLVMKWIKENFLENDSKLLLHNKAILRKALNSFGRDDNRNEFIQFLRSLDFEVGKIDNRYSLQKTRTHNLPQMFWVRKVVFLREHIVPKLDLNHDNIFSSQQNRNNLNLEVSDYNKHSNDNAQNAFYEHEFSYLKQYNKILYCTVIAFRAADVAINTIRFYYIPTYHNAAELVMSATSYYSMLTGISKFAIVANILSVSYTTYENGYTEGIKLLVLSGMYMAIPYVLGGISIPYISFTYVFGMTLYTGYHLVTNAGSLYREIISEDTELKPETVSMNGMSEESNDEL